MAEMAKMESSSKSSTLYTSFRGTPLFLADSKIGGALKACKSCGKTFQSIEKLYEHLEAHRLEDKFKCDLCDKVFRHRNNLCRHRKSHSRVKYACQYCEKLFLRTDILKTHVVTKHAHLIL